MNTVHEGSTAVYTVQLTGPDDVPVPKSVITSVTLTLYDYVTGVIINNRDHQDVLDANNCTINTDGVLTWQLQKEDNPIVNANLQTRIERHVALFEIEWSAGRRTHEVILGVQNYARTPA